jgi:hypothetical protein
MVLFECRFLLFLFFVFLPIKKPPFLTNGGYNASFSLDFIVLCVIY